MRIKRQINVCLHCKTIIYFIHINYYAICFLSRSIILGEESGESAINSNHTFFYANNFVIKISLLQIDGIFLRQSVSSYPQTPYGCCNDFTYTNDQRIDMWSIRENISIFQMLFISSFLLFNSHKYYLLFNAFATN